MTELARLRAIEAAAREWARVHRGCWPSSHIREASLPHEGKATVRDVKRAELALLALVEGEK